MYKNNRKKYISFGLCLYILFMGLFIINFVWSVPFEILYAYEILIIIVYQIGIGFYNFQINIL